MRRRRNKKDVEVVSLLGDDSDSNPPTQSRWSSLALTPSQQPQPDIMVQDLEEGNASHDLQEQEDSKAELINQFLLADVSAPENEEELCVHKTKISQLKNWLDRHPPAPQACFGSRLVLLGGPPGCGKSTLIRVMARKFGYSISEWTAPTLMLWSERNLLGDAGPGYVSKMDAFNKFIGRAKYPCLELNKSNALGNEGCSPAPGGKLIVIDDLPHAHTKEAQSELIETLKGLAASARHPTVCVLTDPSQEKDTNNSTKKEYLFQRDLKNTLEGVGVEVISLPAVNQTNMMRILRRIADDWGLESGKDRLKMMCMASNGDLRNALHTLQMGLCGKGIDGANLAKAKKGKRMRSQEAAKRKDTNVEGMVQKDTMLSAFHALGKILYNKRVEEVGDTSQGQPRKKKAVQRKDVPSSNLWDRIDESSSMTETKINRKYWRPKSNYDPEEIITKSGMDGQQLCSFLSEHCLHFMKDDALEEASLAADYLCCAELMSRYDPSLGSSSTLDIGSGFISQKPLHQAAAESVAVRGVMFSNTAPRATGGMYKFHGPKFKSVEAARGENLESIRTVIGDNMLTCTGNEYAEVILPMVRQLGNWLDLRALVPLVWAHSHEGNVVRCGDPVGNSITGDPRKDLKNLPKERDWPENAIDYIED